MIKEHHFSDQTQMFDALARECQSTLEQAISERPRASFVVSGGRTPIALFERMVTAPLAWNKIDMALVDERWVPASHARSNEKLVQDYLFSALDAAKLEKPAFTGMYHNTESARESVSQCESEYQNIAQPFDITLLGMGPDGHTASLFPNAQGLDEALESERLTTSIIANRSEVTGDELERMTLTRHGILQSRKVILALTGSDKLDVLKQALDGDDVQAMPVRSVLLQDQVDIHVYWAP